MKAAVLAECVHVPVKLNSIVSAIASSSSSSIIRIGVKPGPRFRFRIMRMLSKSKPWTICANLIMDPDSFQVGRFLGSYGFMNITRSHALSYSFPLTGFQISLTFSYSGLQGGGNLDMGMMGKLRTQDVGEGAVNIRLYEGRITQGPRRGTSVIFKVYPGQKAGGVEADMMAANELSTHAYLQSSSKELCPNNLLLLGGFETKTGEQWLAFRNDGRCSAADYARTASEKMPKIRLKEHRLFGILSNRSKHSNVEDIMSLGCYRELQVVWSPCMSVTDYIRVLVLLLWFSIRRLREKLLTWLQDFEILLFRLI